MKDVEKDRARTLLEQERFGLEINLATKRMYLFVVLQFFQHLSGTPIIWIQLESLLEAGNSIFLFFQLRVGHSLEDVGIGRFRVRSYIDIEKLERGVNFIG